MDICNENNIGFVLHSYNNPGMAGIYDNPGLLPNPANADTDLINLLQSKF